VKEEQTMTLFAQSLLGLLFALLVMYAFHLKGINLLPPGVPCPFCALRNWTVRKLFDYIRRKAAKNPAMVTKLAAAMGDFAQFVDAAFDPASPYRGPQTPGGFATNGPFPAAVAPPPPAPVGAVPMPPAIEGVGIFTALPVGPPTMLLLQLLDRLDVDHRALVNLAVTAENKGLKLSTLGSHVHPSECETCKMIAQTQEMLSRFGLYPPIPVVVMCSEVHAVCPAGAPRDHVHDPSTCPKCRPAQTSAQGTA
jgi:hypothetical protein